MQNLTVWDLAKGRCPHCNHFALPSGPCSIVLVSIRHTHHSSPNISPVLLATLESVTKAGTLSKGRARTSIASPVCTSPPPGLTHLLLSTYSTRRERQMQQMQQQKHWTQYKQEKGPPATVMSGVAEPGSQFFPLPCAPAHPQG